MAETKTKKTETEAYGAGKVRRVSAKRKKTRLKKEMAKEKILEKSALEPEEGLVCMGDGCFCHSLDYGYHGMKTKCNMNKKGQKCDAMF